MSAGDKVFVDYSGKKVPIVDPAHRRGARGRDLRRRARRLQPHLRRGDLDPDAAGLDRRARAHVPLLRRRAAPGRARQSEERGPQGLVLRSRDQPQLRHDGGALRRRRPAGPTAQAARQGQGRERGSASPRPTSSAGCGTRPSSRSPSATPRSPTAVERINAHVDAPPRRQPPRSSSRRIERPALRPAAGARTTSIAEWRLARVGIDYHVEVEGFFYSVPHGLIREQVDVRATSRTIEVFHRGQRVAAHQRRYGGRRHGTDPEHMPQLAPALCRLDAGALPALGARDRAAHRGADHRRAGPAARIPSRAFAPASACCGCSAASTPARAEAVSARAVEIGALTYKSIASILAHRLDRAPPQPERRAVIDHANMRGPRYFH